MGKCRAGDGGGGRVVKYMECWDGYLGSGDELEPSFWSTRVIVMVVVAFRRSALSVLAQYSLDIERN